ncbi:MAG: alginate export family protein [Nitrospirae bacterium]|nr:alginate export family protein [Nitrospirota bacterium]
MWRTAIVVFCVGIGAWVGLPSSVNWLNAQQAWAGTSQILLGGEIRARGEFNDDKDFDKNLDDRDSFVGQRSRINLDIQTGKIQGFIQIQDSRKWGEDSNSNLGASGGPFADTADEQQATDLRQANVRVNNLLGRPVTLIYGRQTLSYGDERLIGNFEWNNFSRAFDGIKLSYASTLADVDLFTVKLVEAGTDADSDFSGLYATVKAIPRNNLDLYYLIDIGEGGKNEATLGLRINGTWNAFDYTGEFANQSGDVSNTVGRDAQAYALKGGYTLEEILGGLRIGIEYDFATGDDSSTTDNEAFNNLYPTNHALYGLNDNGNNWSDIQAVAVTLKAKPAKNLWCKIEYWNLQRDTGNTVAGKEGTEINLQAGYIYTENMDVLIQLMNLSPDSASGDDPQQLGVLQTTFKF